ncbi:hypothetical protein CAOG_02449 [Capsaspora owczarzaki ATCC 30864]|uniref:DAGKc domain-containing protein n=1 Tax=Capsaspora owczarzaki (strain ATCC 30864) TaxID=595528 RepID=A0A0D2VMB5_CAPO3|nr:hypothetical protein CAOG_02449 [Capsaspora owczarzaki ATCC 30864]KJE91292.1 hypothetical protein CAOG_002449 [Capsaspora owczarzaki ATCC 30864]|eukprot:XP_004349199.1 hypothetical protein CAOG_02449 [Capsaspora owczarzaki ATCC 30864]
MSVAPPKSALAGKRLMVLVNPIGGARQGRVICNTRVLPFLVAAGVEVEVVETQYRGHALELARETDWTRYDAGLLCIGGDGLIHEVINGIVQQYDDDQATNSHGPNQQHTPQTDNAAQQPSNASPLTIPIGVIPAGSGNGLCASLGITTPEQVVDAMLAGFTAPLDLFRTSLQIPPHHHHHPHHHSSNDTDEEYSTSNTAAKPFCPSPLDETAHDDLSTLGNVGFLSVAWGFLAEFDHLGEGKLRWMGPLRRTLLPLYLLGMKRIQHGRIVFEGVVSPDPCAIPEQPDYLKTPADRLKVHQSTLNQDNQSQDPGYVQSGVLTARYSNNGTRVELEGPFVNVMVCNTPCIADEALAAPFSRCHNGLLDAVVFEDENRFQIAMALDGMTNGSVVMHRHMRYYQCRSFTILPSTPGYMAIDGEVIPAQPITVSVWPRAVRVYSPKHIP